MLFRKVCILLLMIISFLIRAQHNISGSIIDENNEPVFGVTLVFSSSPTISTISNFNGKFSLSSYQRLDTLLIRSIIHKPISIPIDFNLVKDSIEISVEPLSHQIAMVEIITKDPISEKYSVSKVSKLDIYFNPISKGDPLNAIQILPASTNTNETANPELRGGSADRSRVYLNGVPILNPVRNAQNNGLGNFSLFNTELIQKQYVYASNPPLTYGNSSAGLVSIETNSSIDLNRSQIALSLANIGYMLNHKFKEKAFLQLYSNAQGSGPLLKLNSSSLDHLNNFSSLDVGVNFHINLSGKINFNTLSYGINESYRAKFNIANTSDNSTANQSRKFTINNLSYAHNNDIIKISTLVDFTQSSFDFNTLNSNIDKINYFTSLSHRHEFNKKLNLQYNIDYFNSKYYFNEILPTYYYSISDSSSVFKSDSILSNKSIESSFYINYLPTKKLGISFGLRKNLNNLSTFDYLSHQISSFYNFNSTNRLIVGYGLFHSYSLPNSYAKRFDLLSSNQLSFDYFHETKKLNVSLAYYHKSDKGSSNSVNQPIINAVVTNGLEIGVNWFINKNITVGLNNTILDQKGVANNYELDLPGSLKYFIKSQLTYNNPKLFNTSLSLTNRPGLLYSTPSSSYYNPDAKSFQPVYTEYFNNRFNNYFRLDFTINKIINVKNNPIIAFLTISNLTNNKNQMSVLYNQDYTLIDYNYYQERILYFGFQIRIKHEKRTKK